MPREYLDKLNLKTWCINEFYPNSKTDLAVNNVAESWNAKIKEARVSLRSHLMRLLKICHE